MIIDVDKMTDKYKDYSIKMRRHLHENPEVSMKEYNTSDLIKKELDSLNIPWVKCGGETGILATLNGKNPGKTIMLRADMDALTVTEETDLPFKSKNEGIMHACGHDAHTAALITAAHILNDYKDELSGTVKFAFQPGEEVALGAKAMMEDGCLDGVDAVWGMHIWSTLDEGKIDLAPGARMAGGSIWSMNVKGVGGHGSQPQNAIDAGVATCAIVQNLQTIVNRELDPSKMAVVTCGKIEAGTRFNVIPEYGRIEGTTRWYDKDIGEAIPKAIERIGSETAKAFRAEAETKYDMLTPIVMNDEYVTKIAQQSIIKLFGKDALEDNLPPISGSEDYAYFQQKVPGAFAMFGVRNPECGAVYPQHSSHYTFNEDEIIKCALLHAQVASDFNESK